jgi:hypothetical protein
LPASDHDALVFQGNDGSTHPGRGPAGECGEFVEGETLRGPLAERTDQSKLIFRSKVPANEPLKIMVLPPEV